MNKKQTFRYYDSTYKRNARWGTNESTLGIMVMNRVTVGFEKRGGQADVIERL
jgi:hypothetical protein